MYYIESPSTNAYFNLALEQYVFDELSTSQPFFMLWQNANAIIVGKHQNTVEEINREYVKEHDVKVARRLSGGGAVYHDLGNINFTFIDRHDGEAFDFVSFCKPVIKALESMGVTAEVNGRNDMMIEGKKFSGNSQYIKDGHIMHHGTIMYDSNLDVLESALNVPNDKIESKGYKSVRGRVTNVKPHLKNELTTYEFFRLLKMFMFEEYSLKPYTLREDDFSNVSILESQVYNTWDWNYGASPSYEIRKERKVDGCGTLKIQLDIKKGIIRDLVVNGDYFGQGSSGELKDRLIGSAFEESAIRTQLQEVDLGLYFNNLDVDTFITMLLQ